MVSYVALSDILRQIFRLSYIVGFQHLFKLLFLRYSILPFNS